MTKNNKEINLRDYEELMVKSRRDFHKHPEKSWCEFRTSKLIMDHLGNSGWQILIGKQICNFKDIDRSNLQELESDAKKAIALGLEKSLVNMMVKEGTGVVGVLDTGKPGPNVAFRFDIDALETTETKDEAHLPNIEGFGSVNSGVMHACGHDGHIAIGIGLATYIANNKTRLKGKFKLIFQPAEETVSGAAAMTAAGVLEDVDIFISGHIGLGANKLGEIYCGCTDFLAVNRIDAHYKGVAAHSGLAPERGRNALLAAAHAIVNLHTLPTLVKGSKLNVGVINSGLARNIISPSAEMSLETRGETDEANDEIAKHAYEVLKNIAKIYGVTCSTKLVGHAGCANCDMELVTIISKIAEGVEEIDKVVSLIKFGASEDATLMMKEVQKNGGQATYMLFGSDIKGNHHEPNFDFNEKTLSIALATYINFIEKMLGF